MVSTQSKKIVLIEDDLLVASLYLRRLEKEGYAVKSAADGQEGFYLVSDWKPAAIILDLMLPNMNGVDILKKLRAQAQFAAVPILVLTNKYAEEVSREATKAGATEVFDKSKTTPDEIIGVLHRTFLSTGQTARPTQSAPSKIEQAAASERSQESPLGASEDALLSPSAVEAFERIKLEKTFTSDATGRITTFRDILTNLIRAKEVPARTELLQQMHHTAHLFSSGASLVAARDLAQATAAMEAYLRELLRKPQDLNTSAIRTLCQAVDFIDVVFRSDKRGVDSSPQALIVDDDALSRHTAKLALNRVQLKSVTLSNPRIALEVLTENFFDVVVLDVQMPEMDGFTLCKEVRKIPEHKHTPVIFTTGRDDFENRTKSSVSGGTDFIAKPYLLMELALKVLISVQRSRIAKTPVTSGLKLA